MQECSRKVFRILEMLDQCSHQSPPVEFAEPWILLTCVSFLDMSILPPLPYAEDCHSRLIEDVSANFNHEWTNWIELTQ